MKFKNTKLLIGILLIITLSLNIFGCSIKEINRTKEKLPLGELKVTYIDVGQADSIYVKFNDGTEYSYVNLEYVVYNKCLKMYTKMN